MEEIIDFEHGQAKKLKDGRYVIVIKHEDATMKYTLSESVSSDINNAENEIQESMLESIAKSLAQLIDLHDEVLRHWKPHKALEELDCTVKMLARQKKLLQDEWYIGFTNYS